MLLRSAIGLRASARNADPTGLPAVKVAEEDVLDPVGGPGAPGNRLDLCGGSGRVSFADAVLWAHGRVLGESVWTFDGNFPSEGVVVRSP